MAWRKHWLSQLLWVCLQLNVRLLTLISLSVSGGVIRLDVAGHQRHAEMGLFWLEVTALGPCDIVSIDLQWNSFIFCKIECYPTTGIDVAFAMVFWRVKLFPLTHPQPISLILASGHIPLGLPGMLISFVFFFKLVLDTIMCSVLVWTPPPVTLSALNILGSLLPSRNLSISALSHHGSGPYPGEEEAWCLVLES